MTSDYGRKIFGVRYLLSCGIVQPALKNPAPNYSGLRGLLPFDFAAKKCLARLPAATTRNEGVAVLSRLWHGNAQHRQQLAQICSD